MKTSLWVVLCLLAAGSVIAQPHFYLLGQLGTYRADAGSASTYGPYLDQGIKSGTKSAWDLAIGAQLVRWGAIECGYVDFSPFSTGVLPRDPHSGSAAADAQWQTYSLRAYRVTPVITIPVASHIDVSLLAGLTHSTANLQMRDFLRPYYNVSLNIDDDSFHYGVGGAFWFTEHAAVSLRIVHYTFGKPNYSPNKVIANTVCVGGVWRF
ncbi:MAG TPA: outer membrane beta-barrel protein [Opitutaceae bacterium]|nr:outer membrane beta-barrel protein [Opitutaceae bacterium]